jgi:N-acetylmuramic acid 6-phosphate etherase
MAFVKISEQPSLYNDLEKKSVREILEDINTEDQKVALAVQKAIPQIEKLVTQIVPRMKQGGRIFYMGAGTSGRLGVLDASEIPPTFGMPPTLVIGLIAGGDTALRNPVENAEDDMRRGWEELVERNITDKDTVIGIAASGTTPYVIGAMQKAREHGILTGCITSNPDSPMAAKQMFHRNDCRTRICNRKLTHEIGYGTENDTEHDYHFRHDTTGPRER